MTLLESLILGIVEGITEFLPISSTGHLILTAEWLSLKESDFLKSFEIVIQLGAILSVVVLYWRSFLDLNILKKLVVGFIPTGVFGLMFYRLIKDNFLSNETMVLWTLFLGGIGLIVFEFLHKEKESVSDGMVQVTYKQSLLIGVFQSIAIIPGVSRSAATIVGGLLAGLKRTTIVEFSFLLAVPTMLAASGLDLFKNVSSFSGSQLDVLIVGFLVSFFMAMASVKFLLSYVKKHSFIPFGAYRIVIAIAFWLIVLK